MLVLEDLPSFITVLQIKRILRIGQRQAYELVKTEDFQTMKIGNSNLYSKEKFIYWLEGGNCE